jgi:hypothetical protein
MPNIYVKQYCSDWRVKQLKIKGEKATDKIDGRDDRVDACYP